MGKATSKRSLITENTRPDAEILRSLRGSEADLEVFLKAQGGIRCATRKRMEEATDWLLLLGTVEKTRRRMDLMLRRARSSGLLAAGASSAG